MTIFKQVHHFAFVQQFHDVLRHNLAPSDSSYVNRSVRTCGVKHIGLFVDDIVVLKVDLEVKGVVILGDVTAAEPAGVRNPFVSDNSGG